MSTNLKMSCSCLNALFYSMSDERIKGWPQQGDYPVVLPCSLTTRSNLSIFHLKRESDKQHLGHFSFHQKTGVYKYFLPPPN